MSPHDDVSLADASELEAYLTDEERIELDRLVAGSGAPIWTPLPGPQTLAYMSQADVLGYGGAAGGGKSDLGIGKALTQHTRSAIFRREGTQLTGILDRLTEVLGGRDGYNGQERIWRLKSSSQQIEFGSTPNLGDEKKHQGRPKDFLMIDEATNFLKDQVRFLLGWVRTTDKRQKCQALLTFNPPTDADGRWVIEFFAPWLDRKHPNPAAPGELRWFATIDGKDVEVGGAEPFMHGRELIIPQSRTFIPSRVTDNPFLVGTGYMATLQAMPEPLRSQMLYGDFQAGMEDDAFQVIPTAWVEAAMARWKDKDPRERGEMTSIGADPSRGGSNETALAPRHGDWYAPLVLHPGVMVPDGPTAAGLIIAARRGQAAIMLDIVGIGSSVYDSLSSQDIDVRGINGAERGEFYDATGQLRMYNKRAWAWWKMRDDLDPRRDPTIAIHPDDQTLADLTAPVWKMTTSGILIESKEDLVKRIGRSPDRGDAVVYANTADNIPPSHGRLAKQGRRRTYNWRAM